MKRIYIPNIGCDYYISIAKELIKYDFQIRIIGFNKDAIERPKSLNNFIRQFKPKVILHENIHLINNFDKIFDPDYSIFSKKFYSDIHYYEKLFFMSIDRNSFDPISQLESCRLFHKYISHAYKLLKEERIDGVIFFGTPHGIWYIAICAVAKVLNIDIRYSDFGLFPELSTIETDIYIRKSYSQKETSIGLLANPDESNNINDIIDKRVNSHFVWDFNPTNNIKKKAKVIKKIIGLIFIRPFSNYYSSEFFLSRSSRRGILLIPKFLKYLEELKSALYFYEKHAINKLPEKDSLVIFLHHQPEASTMPMGYIFADQILMLEIILNASPKNLNIYIKEHPHMHEYPAEDRHERSEYFYTQLLRDKRVKLLNRNINSKEIINNVKYIVSICGSVSWETLKLGKPCIVFGWGWFSDCDSCYSVDSSKSFLKAIDKIKDSNKEKVDSDVKNFINRYKKRLIYAPALRNALKYLDENYRYQDAVRNLSKALKISFESNYKKESI